MAISNGQQQQRQQKRFFTSEFEERSLKLFGKNQTSKFNGGQALLLFSVFRFFSDTNTNVVNLLKSNHIIESENYTSILVCQTLLSKL